MRRVLLPLMAALVLLHAVPVTASSWTLEKTASGTLELVDVGFILTGPDNGVGSNTITYSTTADQAGTIWFLWAYSTTDSAHFDRPQFVMNGATSDLMSEGQQGNGSIQFDIAPGDVYGFRVWALDSCCGAGVLTVTDPNFVPASPEPSPLQSEEPSPEVPSAEPSATPTPEPTPEPTPSPEPSATATPEPSPAPTPSPQPSPTATVAPTASPTPTPTPTPESPSPSPSVAPSPLPEPSAEPSAKPQPSPTNEPLTIDPGAAVEALSEAVGEAAAFVAKLGHDITPEEKKQAAATIIPAVIVTQLAQAAVAAASAAAGAASSGGSRKGNK